MYPEKIVLKIQNFDLQRARFVRHIHNNITEQQQGCDRSARLPILR